MMSTYKGPCQHGYSEKCPTCLAWEEEQEMDDTIQGYQREIAALKAEVERLREQLLRVYGRALRVAKGEG